MENGELIDIKDALTGLRQSGVATALDVIISYVNSHPYVLCAEDVKEIESNFRLMHHYYESGVNDPTRDKMYENMYDRLEMAICNMLVDWKRRNDAFNREMYSRVDKNMSKSEGAIKSVLEDFVSDVAMLQFEPEATREEKRNAIYERHYAYMQSLFCCIVTSEMLASSQADALAEVILSPTVDSGDAQVIVSALMLAVNNTFDINKFRVLVEVYKRSHDVYIRQKALVGWAFCLSEDYYEKEKISKVLGNLLDDQNVLGELIDLQKQVVFCMNADNDTEIIQRDIMPTLIKNSNMQMRDADILGMPKETIDDILNPGAQDRAMEETEEKFRQMMDMQKSGSDIYFGGFSKMKRFSFFYVVLNWFCPFNVCHPEISKKIKNKATRNFIDALSKADLFCDNDKYSFALGIASVFDRLPESVREVMNNSEGLGFAFPKSEDRQPAFIRRLILQDLLRFYRLSQWHDSLYNPFDRKTYLFVCNSVFANCDLKKHFVELGKFLIRHTNGFFLDIIPYLERYVPEESSKLIGLYYIHKEQFDKAKEKFGWLLKKFPDNSKLQRYYAQACWMGDQKQEALLLYDKLYDEYKDDRAFCVEYADCLLHDKRYADALNLLYRLDYEYPNDAAIKRLFGWALLFSHKADEAKKEILEALDDNIKYNKDSLCLAYSSWFLGSKDEAAGHFLIYLAILFGSNVPTAVDVGRELTSVFRKDKDLLDSYGITAFDCSMMLASVYKKIRKN